MWLFVPESYTSSQQLEDSSADKSILAVSQAIAAHSNGATPLAHIFSTVTVDVRYAYEDETHNGTSKEVFSHPIVHSSRTCNDYEETYAFIDPNMKFFNNFS